MTDSVSVDKRSVFACFRAFFLCIPEVRPSDIGIGLVACQSHKNVP